MLADRDLRRVPGHADDHHSYAGGLLEHTVGVATLCRETAQLHPRLRSELVLAAALLHDVGRTLELARGPAFTPTDEGRLLGHVHLGMRLIEERAEGLDAAQRAELLHCVAVAPRRARRADGRGGRALPREPARRERRHPADRVNGLLLALGASLVWGVADFVGPWQGRALGALRVLLWAQLGGLAVARLVVLAARGRAPHDAAVLLAVPAAISGTLGLYAYYRGMAIGAMAVVAPIAGASAIVPVVFGIVAGDRPSAVPVRGHRAARSSASCSPRRSTRTAGSGGSRRASAWRCSPRVGFGFYFPPMHAAGDADPLWASLVFRRPSFADHRRSPSLDPAAADPPRRLEARDRHRRRPRRHVRQLPLRRGGQPAGSSASPRCSRRSTRS